MKHRPGVFTFTNEERATLTAFRAITTDEQGREVLVGLTFEETAFYMARVRRGPPTIPDLVSQKQYLELDKKHELARLQAASREGGPPR
jgi:hypothetical protein